MDIIPLFKSHYSISGSVLSLDNQKDLYDNETGPDSIIDIALKNNLKEIYLLDTSFSGFVTAYKNCEQNNIQLNFGIQIILCNNINDKSEESKETESKINIWGTESKSYQKLIKIYSKAATDGFLERPRIDSKTLKNMWNDSLVLTIPYYYSFLHRNLLYQSNCLPEIDELKPALQIEYNDLPFNFLIDEAINRFQETNKWEQVNTQSIYYYKKKDFLYYLAYRCLNNRSNLEKPNLEHMASDNFCFEHFLELLNN